VLLGRSAGPAGTGVAPPEDAAPLVLHVIDGHSAYCQGRTAASQYAQSRFLQTAGYRVASVFVVRAVPSDAELAAWIERNYRYWFANECAFSWLVYFARAPDEPHPGSLQCELGNSEKLSVPETLRGFIASGAVDAIWTNDVTSVPFLRSLGALQRIPILCEAHAIRSFQFATQNQRAVDEDELALELSVLADCDMVNSPSASESLSIASRLGPARVTTLTAPILGAGQRVIEDYFEKLSEVFGRLLGHLPDSRHIPQPVREWGFVEWERGTIFAPLQPGLTLPQVDVPHNWPGQSPSRAVCETAPPPDPRAILLGVGDEAILMDLSAPIPGSGWYPAGPGEAGRHRWTGPEPSFTMELFLPELSYRCCMELISDQRNNLDNFSIRLNGAVISYQSAEKNGKRLIEFPIPARETGSHSRLATFVFRHGSVFRPADQGVADERLLGCAVCSIRFERQGAAHGGNADTRPAEPVVNRRALVIDDSVPEPDKDAGSNAVWQHILSLQRLGYKMSFIPADNMARIDPYTADLEQRGVECFYRPRYTSVDDVLAQHPAPFDLVYLHRYANAAKYGGAIRDHSPTARMLYCVADLHFLRSRRQAELENNPVLREEAEQLRDSEVALLAHCDCAIVHSTAEAELIQQMSPGINVHVIPWTVELRNVPKSTVKRPALAFIGGYRHPPNVDAAKWAAQSIMPLLREQVPGVELLLVGSHMPQEVAALAATDIVPVGHVPSLGSVFARIRLTIAPLRYGAGLKGKVLDSMAAGIPCVMTTIAAEGLNLPAELQSLVVDEPRDFSERIATLCRDERQYRRIVAAAQAYIGANYSSQRIDLLIRQACGLR